MTNPNDEGVPLPDFIRTILDEAKPLLETTPFCSLDLEVFVAPKISADDKIIPTVLFSLDSDTLAPKLNLHLESLALHNPTSVTADQRTPDPKTRQPLTLPQLRAQARSELGESAISLPAVLETLDNVEELVERRLHPVPIENLLDNILGALHNPLTGPYEPTTFLSDLRLAVRTTLESRLEKSNREIKRY